MNTCYYYQDQLPRPLHNPRKRALLRKTWGTLPTSPIKSSILTSDHSIVKSGIGSFLARYSYVHFQVYPIRLVSCYALLSGCRLPWPPPSCQYGATPFVGSISEQFVALTLRLVHPTAPVLLTRYGPLKSNISASCPAFTLRPLQLRQANAQLRERQQAKGFNAYIQSLRISRGQFAPVTPNHDLYLPLLI